MKLCKVYSRESKSCDLCLTEKTIIMFSNHYLTTNHTDHFSTLNKRSEILQKCRHRAKHTLEQWWVFFGMHRNINTSLINWIKICLQFAQWLNKIISPEENILVDFCKNFWNFSVFNRLQLDTDELRSDNNCISNF